jgi:acyl transferase domain-containing protein
VLNPHIDFANTPFVVQQALAPWPRPTLEIGGTRRELPRIAGVSSFGAGGANAHVVIEEYRATAEAASVWQGPALVVLSARNEERLREYAQRLLSFVEQRPATPLAALAYTLQVGREAMEERLALVAQSLDELAQKLRAYLAGDTVVDELYCGQAGSHQDLVRMLAGDEGVLAMQAAWLANGRYGKLLELWVQGLNFDWQRMYGERRPRRISLPTYPFARERYWLTLGPAQAAGGAHLHPLLHRNTSTFAIQRFSAQFSGEEFFLADHQVQGMRVLPAAAQLEMLRCAVEQSMAAKAALRWSQISWLRPLVAGTGGVAVHVSLTPQERGEIRFECHGEEGEAGRTIYSQGTVAIVTEPVLPVVHDLAAWREQCGLAQLDAPTCYARFARMGLHYGPAFQGLQEMFVGVDRVLARIALPAAVQANHNDYALHPSLLDAALQAVIGLVGAEGDSRLWLPVALDAMEVLAECASAGWALARRRAGDEASAQFDIDLCDEAGALCVRLQGLHLRVSSAEAKPAPILLASLGWESRPVDPASGHDIARHLVLLCDCDERAVESVRARLPEADCLVFAAGEDFAQAYGEAARALLQQLQRLGREPGRHRVQIVLRGDGVGACFAGLGGMLRTAQREYPHIAGQVLTIESQENVAQLLLDNRHDAATQVRYAEGARQIASWRELSVPIHAPAPWKEGGVYLITGGAGGLGLIFAREIASQAKGVVLLLTGRSPATASLEAKLAELRALGATVRYRVLDVATARRCIGRCARRWPNSASCTASCIAPASCAIASS